MSRYKHRWDPDGSLVILLKGRDPRTLVSCQQEFTSGLREAGFKIRSKNHTAKDHHHGVIEYLGDGWNRITPLKEDFALWLMMTLS